MSGLAGLVRWGMTGAVVLAAHMATGIWLIGMMQRSEAASVPEPIMIDLLPPPEPAAGPVYQPPQQAEAEEAPQPVSEPEIEPEPEPELEVAEFEPPPLTELPPVTDFSELLPESALLLSASERPLSRPVRQDPEPRQVRRDPPKEQPKTQPREQPKREQARSPAKDAQPKQATRQQTQSSGGGGQKAKPTATPAASKQQMASWTSKVGSRITRHMSRTRVSGGRGGRVSVQVAVTISPNGAASGRLASSTGSPQVDQALARQAGRLPRMPAPPNGKPASFVQPVVIQLR
ncbi:MAG: TonB C-terminal domain-containing protein [Paracoccus sp. (in: a-proteobacteria)]